MLVIHGGPGATSLWYSGAATTALQARYGMAFWDQRDAGASAGNDNTDNLSLSQMTSDLASVVRVLKYRYGADIEVFLYAHSFGGLLAASYLTTGSNQDDIRGWIDIDGAHSYPLCNTLSRQMLIDTGVAEIARGSNADKWQPIVDWCRANPANVSLDISMKTEDYAGDAESYVPINPALPSIDWFSPSSPTSAGANLLRTNYTAGGRAFLQSLEPADFSTQLAVVKIPSLLIWGRYDFVVPLGVGQNALANLGSPVKQLVVLNHSGHGGMYTETNTVNQEIEDFIEANK